MKDISIPQEKSHSKITVSTVDIMMANEKNNLFDTTKQKFEGPGTGDRGLFRPQQTEKKN